LLVKKSCWTLLSRLHGRDAAPSSPVYVVVVRLRVNVVLHHGESDDVVGATLSAHSLDYGRAAIRQVPMNRKVRIVLELKLLLLLPGQRHRLICTFLAMHFTGGYLLRLEAFLVASTARWLPTLALSNDVFLCFFKFTAVHVLGCIGCPDKDKIECC